LSGIKSKGAEQVAGIDATFAGTHDYSGLV
jgi:hypothetical protein